MILKDNTFYSDSNLFLRGKKALLNYFSVPVKELSDNEDSSILLYPQSFSDTSDEIGEQFVFEITRRDTDGNPVEFWTKNLVGFISYKGQEITISSRFSGEKNDSFLYYMLARVSGINLLNLDFGSQNNNNGLNLMLFLFPKLLKEALGQGLFKQYIYREYNDANIRGAIDINRHIRRNIPFNGRVAYRTREFNYDNPVTQLVRHAIEWIKVSPWGQAILNSDDTTRLYLQEIIAATPTYEARLRQEIINQNLRPATHPYYTSWLPLQKFCLRLLRHESLSYGADKKNKIHGLLIDAAWLWEEYIGQVLSEDTEIKHYTRKNSHYHLFRDKDGAFQKIIPDYYDGNKIVADAKYIPLNRSRDLDADRAAPIYYKTIMYMYRFNTEKGFLFHPVAQEEAKNEEVVVSDYTIEDRGTCHLYELGLVVADTAKNEKEKNLYAIFRNRMNNNEKKFIEKVKEKIESNL